MKAVQLWRVLNTEPAEAKRRVESLVSAVKSGLESGRFELKGFGQFVVRDRPERVGRNPMTGEEIKIPAKRVVAFKPAASLKRAVGGAAPALKIADPGLRDTVQAIVATLAGEGGENGVKVEGLGTFRKVVRKERVGRNPRTGEEIRIAASASVAYRPDGSLLGGPPGEEAEGADEEPMDEDEGDEG